MGTPDMDVYAYSSRKSEGGRVSENRAANNCDNNANLLQFTVSGLRGSCEGILVEGESRQYQKQIRLN